MQKEKAILVIAKLDRLGRNVAFIANLMESNVDFVAVDNPEAKPLILHILAAFAQHEREQISSRTIDALQAAKRRGVKLGLHGKNVISKRNAETAQLFVQKMQPVIHQLQKDGFLTIRSITTEMNRQKIPTFRNNAEVWHLPTVHRLVQGMNKKTSEQSVD